MPKPYWIGIAISIISQIMLQWLVRIHYFGKSDYTPFNAASHLASWCFGAFSHSKAYGKLHRS